MKKKKKIVTATQARRELYNLIRQANKPGGEVTITLAGEKPVMLISQEEIESWMETLEVMSDPQLVKDIREAGKETSGVDWDDFKKELGWSD